MPAGLQCTRSRCVVPVAPNLRPFVRSHRTRSARNIPGIANLIVACFHLAFRSGIEVIPRTRELLPTREHRARSVQVVPAILIQLPARLHRARSTEVIPRFAVLHPAFACHASVFRRLEPVPFSARLVPAGLERTRSRCIAPIVAKFDPLVRSHRARFARRIPGISHLIEPGSHGCIGRIEVIPRSA